jgi:hypothetical protein
MRAAIWIVVVCLILAGGLSWQASFAQSGESEYFKETGHWVSGEFLIKYRSIPNAEELYGYPITDSFIDHTTDTLVQYFEKARFELDPSAPTGRRAKLSKLGEYLYEPDQPLSHPAYVRPCRKVGPGEFRVCQAFLEFFDANGGVAQFGSPISNAEWLNGWKLQCFTFACFEWHPELPPGQRVVVSDLGRQHFLITGFDRKLLGPNQDNGIPKAILSLKVRAYPVKAVTGLNGTQSVYIIVQDQRLLPVSNAQATLVVRMPSGEEYNRIVTETTNDQGITRYTFDFKTSSIGLAVVEVNVTYEGLSAQTVTSFRIWW